MHPAGGQRDGLIHAIYGGVYGKVHAVLDGHSRTSPEVLPVLAHHGPAASCGLTRYESPAFGDDYRDNLFACLFNLRTVKRHALEPQGGTFLTRDADFVVSNNWDFHPTDVQEDADGSLCVFLVWMFTSVNPFKLDCKLTNFTRTNPLPVFLW